MLSLSPSLSSSFSFGDDGGFMDNDVQASINRLQMKETGPPFQVVQNQPLKLSSSWNDLRDSSWISYSSGRNRNDGDGGEVNGETAALDGYIRDDDELSLDPLMASQMIEIPKQTSKESRMTKLSASWGGLLVFKKSPTGGRKMMKKQASWKDLFGNSQKHCEPLVDVLGDYNPPRDITDEKKSESWLRMPEEVVVEDEEEDFGDIPKELMMEDNDDFHAGKERVKRRGPIPIAAKQTKTAAHHKPYNARPSRSMGSLNRSMESLNSRKCCSDCLGESTKNATWESSATKKPQTAVAVKTALHMLNSEAPSNRRSRERCQGKSLSRSIHSSSNGRSRDQLCEASLSRSLRRLQAWEETGKS